MGLAEPIEPMPPTPLIKVPRWGHPTGRPTTWQADGRAGLFEHTLFVPSTVHQKFQSRQSMKRSRVEEGVRTHPHYMLSYYYRAALEETYLYRFSTVDVEGKIEKDPKVLALHSLIQCLISFLKNGYEDKNLITFKGSMIWHNYYAKQPSSLL